jgi:hypothetical protein
MRELAAGDVVAQRATVLEILRLPFTHGRVQTPRTRRMRKLAEARLGEDAFL